LPLGIYLLWNFSTLVFFLQTLYFRFDLLTLNWTLNKIYAPYVPPLEMVVMPYFTSWHFSQNKEGILGISTAGWRLENCIGWCQGNCMIGRWQFLQRWTCAWKKHLKQTHIIPYIPTNLEKVLFQLIKNDRILVNSNHCKWQLYCADF